MAWPPSYAMRAPSTEFAAEKKAESSAARM
jgi:hypothetical protein